MSGSDHCKNTTIKLFRYFRKSLLQEKRSPACEGFHISLKYFQTVQPFLHTSIKNPLLTCSEIYYYFTKKDININADRKSEKLSVDLE